MKARNSSIAVWKTLVVAMTVLALGGLAGSALAAAAPSQITIHDQDLTSGVIVASSVTSPVDGWIVVYKDPNNLTGGQIVGYAQVRKGANSNVKITLDTAKIGDMPTLWAVLQADNGLPGVFEWGWKGQSYNDAPVVENGHNVVTSFGTAASMAAASTTPASVAPAPAVAAPVATKAPVTTKPATTTASPIVIKNQDITSGVIVANSVTSPVDGWIVVYKDSNNLTGGQIVGYAQVRKGANSNVKITLDTAKVGDLPTLWAVLQADNGLSGVFEWGWKGQSYNDTPVVVNGHNIVAAFGTAADQ